LGWPPTGFVRDFILFIDDQETRLAAAEIGDGTGADDAQRARLEDHLEGGPVRLLGDPEASGRLAFPDVRLQLLAREADRGLAGGIDPERGEMFLREIVEDRPNPEHERAADPRRLAEIEAPDARPIDDIEEAAPLRHDAGIERARPGGPDDERDLDILVVPLPDGLAIARLEEVWIASTKMRWVFSPYGPPSSAARKEWERARAGRFRRGTPAARVRGRVATSMRQGNSVCFKAPGCAGRGNSNCSAMVLVLIGSRIRFHVFALDQGPLE
jgi:hypothetical protein